MGERGERERERREGERGERGERGRREGRGERERWEGEGACLCTGVSSASGCTTKQKYILMIHLLAYV